MTTESRPPWDDAEPDEAPLVAAFASSRGRCPAPELVSASKEGVLTGDLQTRVAAHVEGCHVCRTLQEALADLPADGLTAVERQRIRARVRGGTQLPPRGLAWAWWRKPGAVLSLAATLAIVTIGYLAVWQSIRVAVAPEPQKIAVARRPSDAPSVLRLDKLPVRLPDGDLLWRGAPADDRREALQDLAAALEPYGRDDFADAARRLRELITRRPRDPLAHLYLGVSELFLARYDEAVAALSSAERLAAGDPELSTEAAWYLALAYQRSGRRNPAIATFERLCQGRSVRSALGCAALLELSTGDAKGR